MVGSRDKNIPSGIGGLKFSKSNHFILRENRQKRLTSGLNFDLLE